MDLKRVIAIIVSPFAVASSVLLLILSMLEFWRRGFVSLFLDLRAVMIVALALWAIAALTDDEPRRHRRLWPVLIAVALLACLPILWTLIAPFGRLGLLTFSIGIVTATLIFVASIKKFNS